ncbi:hypothetical protein L1049_012399 [Liquidambar formosana]|uniref:Uncharacterized protein n=1 Tax=Liquidambar formosana TaxID=63359 RepID=A0AAP0R314_LIQFO
MLQKNARLELHNSSFYIVPKWVMIFRRIFNWWLMSLSTEAFSAAYVLERHSVASPTSRGLDELNLEASISSTYNLLHPSLDEMVEVGCSPLLSRKGQPEPEPFQTSSGTVSIGGGVLEATNASELMEDERNLPWEGELVETDDGTYVNSGLNNISGELVAAATMVKKEDDKLSKLLEQFRILQNMIDEKLSIFF